MSPDGAMLGVDAVPLDIPKVPAIVALPVRLVVPVTLAFPPTERFASRVVFPVTSRVPGKSTVVPVDKPTLSNADDV